MGGGGRGISTHPEGGGGGGIVGEGGGGGEGGGAPIWGRGGRAQGGRGPVALSSPKCPQHPSCSQSVQLGVKIKFLQLILVMLPFQGKFLWPCGGNVYFEGESFHPPTHRLSYPAPIQTATSETGGSVILWWESVALQAGGPDMTIYLSVGDKRM